MQQIGGQASGAQQAARRAAPKYSRGNAAFRGHTGTAAPVLWARGCPPGLCLLVPIETPLGFFRRKIQRVRLVSFYVVV